MACGGLAEVHKRKIKCKKRKKKRKKKPRKVLRPLRLLLIWADGKGMVADFAEEVADSELEDRGGF